MNSPEKIKSLWEHVFWADVRLFNALKTFAGTASEAHREFSHIIGAEETWLARIEQRPSRTAVWPEVTFTEVQALMEKTHSVYRLYLAELPEYGLDIPVIYTNSAGQQFTNSVGEILLHVALHGQYHRGKVNLLLRKSGQEPAPTDYIAFLRGAPAAVKNH